MPSMEKFFLSCYYFYNLVKYVLPLSFRVFALFKVLPQICEGGTNLQTKKGAWL